MKKYLVCLALFTIGLAILWGWEMETFTNKNNVYGFFEADGNLFAVTWGGVVNMETGESFTTEEGLGATDITDAWVDTVSGFVWLGSGGKGVVRFDFQQCESLQPFNSNYGLLSDFATAVAGYVDEGLGISTVLVGTEEGLSAFESLDGGEYTFKNTYTIDSGLSNNWVTDILIFDGVAYVATQSGLTVFPLAEMDYPEQWKAYSAADGLPNSEIHCLEINDGIVYCGTDSWICQFNPASEEFSVLPPSSVGPNWPVYDMHFREDGSLWTTIFSLSYEDLMAEKQYGLAVYQGGEWQLLKTADGAPTNALTGLYEVDGSLFVGSWGKGAYALQADAANLNDAVWQPYIFPGPAANQISVLALDDANNLWYATGGRVNLTARQSRYGNRGFGFYNNNNDIWQNYSALAGTSPLAQDKIIALGADGQGRIWVGAWKTLASAPHALACYSLEAESFQVYDATIDDFLYNNQFAAFGLNESGDFYISGYAGENGGGITILPNSEIDGAVKFLPQKLYDGLSDIYSFAFYENEVWMGARLTGLQSWTPTSALFPETDGDAWNTYYPPVQGWVYDMEFDDDGNLIMATSEGLMIHFRESDNLYIYNAFEKKKRWTPDWTEEGQWVLEAEYAADEARLGNGECSEIADVEIDAQGNVWLATYGGGISLLTEED